MFCPYFVCNFALPFGTYSVNRFAERSLDSRTSQAEIDTRHEISQKMAKSV
jgi:hypothetical protein